MKFMVYGNRFMPPGRRQGRVIAGVRSRAEFCRLTGQPDLEAKNYGSDTGNPQEVLLGTTHPGIAWFTEFPYGPSGRSGPWEEWSDAQWRFTGRRVMVVDGKIEELSAATKENIP